MKVGLQEGKMVKKEKKDHSIKVRMSEEEYKRAMFLCQIEGKNLSELIRSLLFDREKRRFL